MGDNAYAIERLASSLAEIRRRFAKDKAGMLATEYIAPDVAATPKEAFYAPSRAVDIHQSPGFISSEFVMCYPPGIPIIAPGERITSELVEHVLYSKEKGCLVTGAEDLTLGTIRVMA
jgi:arginine/lysine/ornithine decarboxylase